VPSELHLSHLALGEEAGGYTHAMINGYADKKQGHTLPLQFLGDGKHDAFLCRNTQGSNKIRTESCTINSGDKLDITMNPTGGFVGHFRRQPE